MSIIKRKKHGEKKQNHKTFNKKEISEEDKEKRKLFNKNEISEEDKEEQKKIWILNKAGIILLVCIYFLTAGIPIKYSIVVNTLIPIIGIGLAIKYKGIYIIKKGKKNSAVPLISIVLFPSLRLFALADDEYVIDTSILYWIYIIILVAVLLYVILKYTTYINGDSEYNLFIIVCVIVYCFGVIENINCGLYTKNETVYKVEVVNKYISKGARDYTGHYIELEQFGEYKDKETLDISDLDYENININDKVNVRTCKGILGIGWYKIDFYSTYLDNFKIDSFQLE